MSITKVLPHRWKDNECVKCGLKRRIDRAGAKFENRYYLVDGRWLRTRPQCIDATQPVVKYSEEELIRIIGEHERLEKLIQKQNQQILELKSEKAMSDSLLDMVSELGQHYSLIFEVVFNQCNITMLNRTKGKELMQTLPLDQHMDKDRVIECIKFMKNKLEL